MDGEQFVEAVREENRTALSRLGSSKALYADTGGEMDDDTVLTAAADRAHAAAETFDAWADDESHGEVQELFGSVAAAERDHCGTITAELDGYEPVDPPAVVDNLCGVGGTVERVGALVGWALAAGNNTDQLVGYFVGQADPGTAETFRGIGGEQEAYVADATAVLESVCAGDDDWTAALDAARGTVQADYDDYVATLESLGVNPKPVC